MTFSGLAASAANAIAQWARLEAGRSDDLAVGPLIVTAEKCSRSVGAGRFPKTKFSRPSRRPR